MYNCEHCQFAEFSASAVGVRAIDSRGCGAKLFADARSGRVWPAAIESIDVAAFRCGPDLSWFEVA